MKAPFLPLFVGDYLRDTRSLTTEQHGAYLLLLMSMWTCGGDLPNDDRKLARFANCALSRWMKIRDDVMEFFTVEDGVVFQKRLRFELEKASEKSIKNRENGTAGGRAKSLKNKETDVANASQSPQQRARAFSRNQNPEREDAAPPPDGGVAHVPILDPPSDPAPTSNGGSPSPEGASAGARVEDAVKRAAAEEVLRDPEASDEERYFALRYRLEDAGVAWSRAMQLVKLHQGEGFRPVVAAVEKTLRARNPSSYFGAVVVERRKLLADEAGEPEPRRRSNGDRAQEPDFVREYREDGYDVAPDGPGRWIIAGQIYDDQENLIGW